MSGRGADRGEEAGDGLAGLRDECRGAGAAAGGVGVPGPVSDRRRLVAVERAVAGPDAGLPPGRGAHPGIGLLAQSGVACVDPVGVGGSRAAAPGRGPVAGGLCRSARPPDGPSQRGTAAGCAEDNQHQCRRGEWADACAVVAVDGGAKAPPGTLGSTTRLVRIRRARIPRTSLNYERTVGYFGRHPSVHASERGILLRTAEELYEELIRQRPEELGLQAKLGTSYWYLGKAGEEMGDRAKAEEYYGKALSL